MILLVGAGRFERPTPCAQVIRVIYSVVFMICQQCFEPNHLKPSLVLHDQS